MNLADNLKKIRKEHNLSQEQLAEQLGVSRQSVSKWESGSAYPEMDKMLQLCQIFNLNIDELLNQDIKEVNNNKQSKNNINKFIDDFLDYITKTIYMFSNMSFKEKTKCVLEQCIIVLVLIIALTIVGLVGSEILSSLISFFPNKIYYPVFHIFKAIYITASLILSIALIAHIFKVRYLDYYVVKNKNTKDSKENSLEIVNDKKEETNIEKEEKVIIRDPEHSGYKFISGLLKCILVFVKFIFACLGLAFCFSLIAFIILIVLSFTFIKTGMLFTGVLLCLIACVIINIITLIFIYNFIISRKTKKDKMAIMFLISLVIIGIGVGYTTLGISKFEIVTNINSSYNITEEKEYKMTDNLFFESYNNIEFIESENKNIKVVYTYSPIYDMKFIEHNSGYYITTSLKDYTEVELIKRIINDFNNKKIVNYSDFKISIYTTKENIKTLKSNSDKYYRYQEENHVQEIINNYEKQIAELNNNCNID